MTYIIDGNELADSIRTDLEDSVQTLEDEGVTPGLATVLMSDDPASETYVSMKQKACEEIGMESFHVEIDPDAPAEELYDTIDELNANPEVHGILVQLPVPDQVDESQVLQQIDPIKDVDGFHPTNVGLMVSGNARFKPATPHGVLKMIEDAGVDTEGKDVTVVGRSNIVGKPVANLLMQKTDTGNATVTVCHSRTENLAEKTRNADIVIAAAGVPEMIDGSMLSEGQTVIDVGTNRVDDELVGDVDFESAKDVVDAISPVPGGVGPMTITMLLYNTAKAAALQEDVDVELP
ncbi:MAG: tetrahydrofolate dehydrogenase/cyclohydrolase catalytic domain-containing protein [Halodesulfurarchaeum sp.]